MISLILTFLELKGIYADGGYTASQYDVIAKDIHEQLAKVHGYLEDHNTQVNVKRFGDISIMTLNGHADGDLIEKDQEKEILRLLDTEHPAILALQAVTMDMLNNIEASLKSHYRIVNSKFINVDIKSKKQERKPFIFDTTVLDFIQEASFTPDQKPLATYATWGIFRHKKTNSLFSVVNIDLFSDDEETIDVQMFTILKHIETTPYKELPVIFAGTINKTSKDLAKLIETTVKNTLLEDKNNKNLSKTTFHDHGKLDDNVERDFIAVKSKSDTVTVNYSRILSEYSIKSFEHYPVLSILTFKQPQK